MCLDRLLPDSEIQKLPEEFTAYKVMAELPSGRYYPPISGARAYKKKNYLPEKRETRAENGRLYRPYYHCFRTKRGALKWTQDIKDWPIVEIMVKRKDIGCVGMQEGCKVIVTKAFTTDFEVVK